MSTPRVDGAALRPRSGDGWVVGRLLNPPGDDVAAAVDRAVGLP